MAQFPSGASNVARWVRVEAAKHETSVSRLVGEMLRERMRSEDAYEEARIDEHQAAALEVASIAGREGCLAA